MTIDRNFRIFAPHVEWWTLDKNVGYIPTASAPKEAVEAMKKYNSYTYAKNK